MSAYAIVTSFNKGYIPTANALFNGLNMYGNDVKLFAATTPAVPKEYIQSLPPWITTYPIEDFPEIEQTKAKDLTKGLPWEVRFVRYAIASKIAKDFDVILILDSDCFVVDNIMQPFELVAKTGDFRMVTNPLGRKAMPAGMRYIDVYSAQQPPYHCHGAFFPKRFFNIFDEVLKMGINTTYGDMVCLCRVLYSNPEWYLNIRPMPNELWCMTEFWDHKIEADFESEPKLMLTERNDRVKIVHGKWNNSVVRQKEVASDLCKNKELGAVNVELFAKVYDWFNVHGTIKLPQEEEALQCQTMV